MDIIRDFEAFLNRLGYAKKTIKGQVRSSKEFLERIDKSIKTITSEDILTHYNYLLERPNKKHKGGLSLSYINSHIYSLKILFKWQQSEGQILQNPMSGISLPKAKNRPREILTPEEIEQLFALTENHKERGSLSLYYGCGLRRQEGARLNLEDINFRQGLLYVRAGKGGVRRVVPLSKEVKINLENYVYYERRDYLKTKGLMIGNVGERMSGASHGRLLKELLERAKIEKRITLHSLRHSIATHLLMKGMALEKIRDFLGHKHLETTMVYTRVLKEQIDEFT